MNSEELQRLTYWSEHLSAELAIDSDEFRAALMIDNILDLAGVAAHTVLRPAAPITTFLVGYAAGMAAASGIEPSAAIRSADKTARAALNAPGQHDQIARPARAAQLHQPGHPSRPAKPDSTTPGSVES